MTPTIAMIRTAVQRLNVLTGSPSTPSAGHYFVSSMDGKYGLRRYTDDFGRRIDPLAAGYVSKPRLWEMVLAYRAGWEDRGAQEATTIPQLRGANNLPLS